jgi:uncharacterized damage-inducible protein DinB
VRALRLFATVFVLTMVATLQPVKAQSVSLKAELLKDWTDLKGTMDKLAAEMPDDKYTAKPTPAQQSFGERVVHVATVNVGILGSLGGKAAKPAIDAKATTKAAAIKALDDSFNYGIALLNEQTDQAMLTAVPMPPRFLGPSSHARIYTFLMGHTWDIYGQLVVYLRLNGHVPPASQRP